ncbi:MAG: DUF1016 family protein [Bacilli bacterium]|nr:DUF1016 family protein [Bacilli bacterium]
MNYYDQIKGLLISNEIYKKVKDYSRNKSDLDTKYNVGKILALAGKHYGEGIIKEYSVKLTNELGIGYDITSLRKMRQFYYLIEKGAPLERVLSWSHYKILLPIEDINEVNYYINICKTRNISKRELTNIIKNKEYDRLPEETKIKLKNNNQLEIGDDIKSPLILHNKNNIIVGDIKEEVLKKLILEDLDSFLSQLGKGFTYVGNEYKIKIGDRFNYIDILLYNVIFHCYVVVELKVTELKKEHIGQTEVYMNYINENVKQDNDNKTIGLIIVRENNKFIIKYSSDKRIKAVEYKLL